MMMDNDFVHSVQARSVQCRSLETPRTPLMEKNILKAVGRPRGQVRHKDFFRLFFLLSFFFLSLLATKLSPGANFYCLRCFSRQSILAAAVFSFLFEAIYYKLGRVHTTPQRLSYRRQFSYMGIFSGKKTFKITTAAVYPSIAQQKEVLRQTLSSVFSLSEKSYVGSSLSDLKL